MDLRIFSGTRCSMSASSDLTDGPGNGFARSCRKDAPIAARGRRSALLADATPRSELLENVFVSQAVWTALRRALGPEKNAPVSVLLSIEQHVMFMLLIIKCLQPTVH